MATNKDDFLKKLLAIFGLEADEHIQAMSSGLVALETMPAGEQRAQGMELIYREAHSLKGAARAVNLTEMEALCHALESVIDRLKSGRLAATPLLFDLLHQTLEALGGLLACAGQAPAQAQKRAGEVLLRRLDDALRGAPVVAPAVAEDAAPLSAEAVVEVDANFDPGAGPLISRRSTETIRVTIAKLDSVMRQTEELLAPRLAADERARELRELGVALGAWKKLHARIRPAMRTVERSFARAEMVCGTATERRELAKLLEYLDAEPPLMKLLEDRLAKLESAAASDHRALSAMVDGLLHDVREMHMLSFSSLLDAFPRLARELARDQGKQVELTLRGREIEADRRILEQIKDPLNHLLRNCIDHGVEPPAVRERQGKPAHARLTIAVAHKNGSKVEIMVADDGAGIDLAKVKAASAKLGLMSAEELGKLDERQALALVFQSGLSTSPIVTELSGRGLGLAIVREKVERLGGTIVLESQPGQGSAFRIVLPLTLATFRGVLVRAGGQVFVIPALDVERVAQVADKEVRTVENRETIVLDGQALSLVDLADVLEVPRSAQEPAQSAQVVVLGRGSGRIAFRVDAVLAEQEVLVKGLGPQLARVRNLAGASVLGTGQVVAVLNVPDLLQSALGPAARPPASASDEPHAAPAQRSIMVAEDSITSRALIKNILESAGYKVTTAVDGVEAYTALKSGSFDLLVSDVEMPRMDGFDLTAKLRADKALAHLPIVLVTALESREHRERGIDVGANAYVVKRSFDQSNLLEIVGRLI
ncbi:MAG: hybrid sensor histidine kinase/response regulator [Rhodoferax sp.]